MGRHTAPIPIVVAEPPPATRPVQVTDPALLDDRAARRPGAVRDTAPARRGTRAWSAALPTGPTRPAPPRTPVDDDSDLEIDELPVAVDRRTARSVLDAQDEAAAAEAPPPRLPRVRDLVFAGSAIAVLLVAVGATLLP